MSSPVDRLRSLTVANVMTTRVCEVSAHQMMEEVARQMVQRGVSSAPVVDEKGHCVGMISASDYLKRTCPPNSPDEWPAGSGAHCVEASEADGTLDIVPGSDMVGCYMAQAVQSVTSDTPFLHAARIMCAEHIHHLPVLDNGRIAGMVSSMDIVAALLNAIDEAAADRAIDTDR